MKSVNDKKSGAAGAAEDCVIDRLGTAAGGPGISRRALLAGLAAIGAGALIPGCETTASAPGAAGAKPHRIDIHHHLLPPNYIAEIMKRRKTPTPSGRHRARSRTWTRTASPLPSCHAYSRAYGSTMCRRGAVFRAL